MSKPALGQAVEVRDGDGEGWTPAIVSNPNQRIIEKHPETASHLWARGKFTRDDAHSLPYKDGDWRLPPTPSPT